MIRDDHALERIRAHNARRAAKKHAEALEELAEQCAKMENTLGAIIGPVSGFLVKHAGFKEGDPMPLGTELADLLEGVVNGE